MKNLIIQARAGKPLGISPFIDMHGHVGRFTFAIPEFSIDSLMQAVDRLGVKKIFISHMSCMSYEMAWGNDVIARAMRSYPGRVEGYISLWPDKASNVQKEVKRCLVRGFGGFKMHNSNGVRYIDEAYQPAWAAADEKCLPVLLHTWGDEPTLSDVRELSKKYPQAAIIAAHAGSRAEEKYISLARDCPNVYLDLAFSLGPRGLVDRFVQAVTAKKIVFGSDALFFSLHHQVGKVIGAYITESEKRLILGKNAARILSRRKLYSCKIKG